MNNQLNKKLTHLEGVGIQHGILLSQELGLYTYHDLLNYFPLRYEDRSRFYKVNEIRITMPYIQVKGRLGNFQLQQKKKNSLLLARG